MIHQYEEGLFIMMRNRKHPAKIKATAEEIQEADSLLRSMKRGYGQPRDFSHQIRDASPAVVDLILVYSYTHFYEDLYYKRGVLHLLNEASLQILIEKASPEAVNYFICQLRTKLHYESVADSILGEVCRPWIPVKIFDQLISKASVFALCTAMLRGKRSSFINTYGVDTTRQKLFTLKQKAPFMELLVERKEYNNDDFKRLFNELYTVIFLDNQLTSGTPSWDDCRLWLNCLYEVQKSNSLTTKDETTNNQMEASLMFFNWAISFKEKDTKKGNQFKEQAMKHAMNITSPVGLSIDHNLLIYDFYKMKSQELDGLPFLKEAAMACRKNNITDHPAYIEFMAKMSSVSEKENDDWLATAEDEKKDAVQKIEKQYKDYKGHIIKKYIDHVAESLRQLQSAAQNEDKETKQTVHALAKSISDALIQARLSIDAIKNEDIEKKEEVMNTVLKNLKTCFNQQDAKIQTLKTNKSILPFLKNLAVCIATIPVFGAGFVYAGVWATHYAKHKEHLRFNRPTTKEAKTLQQSLKKFSSGK